MKTKYNLFQICLLGAMLLALTSEAQPVIISQPTNQIAVYGGSATFSVMATGVGPFTYQWQLNGTNLANNIITTVAGNGSTNYSGDGGQATNAGIYWPQGVSLDATNNIYIADTLHHRIRKVATTGIITTVAGNGLVGSSGDGSAAIHARLNEPCEATPDSAGNLYIADYYNNRIRLVGTNGNITTVVTNGLSNPSCVTLGSAGIWYICDQNNHRIAKVASNGIVTTVAGIGLPYGSLGDGGPATSAVLSSPNAVALDSIGNLYIADQDNARIRKVGTNGIINTIAGNGTFGFSGDGGPATNAAMRFVSGVCVDGVGGYYISDYSAPCIRYVDTNGIITTVAGTADYGFSGDGGAATNAKLGRTSWVTLDALGNLYLADQDYHRVREVHFAGIPTYTLNNVTATDVGSYQVVVTGAGGSVTSSVVSLTVNLPPIISKIALNAEGTVALHFISPPNSTNEVLCATNLSLPIVWQSLSTNIAGPDGNWQFTDTNAATYQTRFYSSLTH